MPAMPTISPIATAVTLLQSWIAPRSPSEIRKPSARWSTRKQARRRALRVVEVVRETPTTSTLVLEPVDQRPLRHLAGQHLTLFLEIDGVAYRRCYSFSTAPGAEHAAITVKHVPGGVVSAYVSRHVRAQQIVLAADPSGTFTVEPDPRAARRYVMIAGGVGITPLIAMTEAILRGEPQSRVVLLFGNRSAQEIIFRRRIAALAEEFRGAFDVRLALDRPPADWRGLAGRLDGRKVLDILGTLREVDAPTQYFVCGPEPMMESVVCALRAAGVPSRDIRLERFAYATKQAGPRPASSFSLTFRKSGIRVATKPGLSILQLALEAGVPLDYSCQMGGCGSCKVKTDRSAVIVDEPNCLTAAEAGEGFTLACCAYPAADVVVEDH